MASGQLNRGVGTFSQGLLKMPMQARVTDLFEASARARAHPEQLPDVERLRAQQHSQSERHFMLRNELEAEANKLRQGGKLRPDVYGRVRTFVVESGGNGFIYCDPLWDVYARVQYDVADSLEERVP
jgi:hypothetical protein